MGVGDTLTINVATTSGAAVEWTRSNGVAATATIERGSSNSGVIKALANGQIKVKATVQTSSTRSIVHEITVLVVTAQLTSPATVFLGSEVKATVTTSNFPTSGTGPTPVYAWTSTGNQLTRKTPLPATETLTADYIGANTGASTVTFTATWAGTAAGSYHGRIIRTTSITVQGPQYATDIGLSQSTVNMIPGQTLVITASTVPATITQGYSFSWASNADETVKVKSDGLYNVTGTLTAIETGTAVITVTLTQDGGTTLTKNVTVNVVWPTFTISGPQSVVIGTNEQYSVSSLPGGYSIEWSCDPVASGGDATIDSTGMLFPTDPGKVVVTATLLYGGNPTGATEDKIVTILDDSIG